MNKYHTALAFASLLLLPTMQCTKPTERRQSFDERYDQWRESLERQLDEGRSWVYGDVKLLEQLGKEVRQHDSSMIVRLKADMFAVIVLEASHTLPDEFKSAYPAGLDQRRAVWIRVLSGSK